MTAPLTPLSAARDSFPTFASIPRFRIVETVGGYWRALIHGQTEDAISRRGTDGYDIIDIARGATRDECAARASEWLLESLGIANKHQDMAVAGQTKGVCGCESCQSNRRNSQ